MGWAVAGYEAVEMVGRGGTGEVWRARHRETGEQVALKRLRQGPDAEVARLRHEAVALVSVRHSALLGLHQVLVTNEGIVLVLDLVSGGDLATVLSRRGRLTIPEAVGVLGPVADALQAAHAAGVVHGDISAANILLHPDGRPVLADLGTARLAGDGVSAGLTCAYADPGVAAGLPPDAASDIFGLAAVAWHAITGEPLWRADSAAELLEQSEAGPVGAVDPAWGLPQTVADLLLDALRATPAMRPSAADFAGRLRAVCQADPLDPDVPVPARGEVVLRPAVTIEPSGPPEVLSLHPTDPSTEEEPPRRRTGLLVAATLVVLLFGGGLGWLAFEQLDGSSAPPQASPAGSSESRSTPEPQSGPTVPVSASAAAADGMTGDARANEGGDVDWRAEVDRLVQTRALAYAGPDVELLNHVYAPGSDLLTQERERVSAFGRAVTLTHRILEVTPAVPSPIAQSGSEGPGQVTLVVRETVPVATPVTGHGAAPGAVPEKEDALDTMAELPVRDLRMVLTGSGQGWLIASVAPV